VGGLLSDGKAGRSKRSCRRGIERHDVGGDAVEAARDRPHAGPEQAGPRNLARHDHAHGIGCHELPAT